MRTVVEPGDPNTVSRQLAKQGRIGGHELIVIEVAKPDTLLICDYDQPKASILQQPEPLTYSGE